MCVREYVLVSGGAVSRMSISHETDALCTLGTRVQQITVTSIDHQLYSTQLVRVPDCVRRQDHNRNAKLITTQEDFEFSSLNPV